MSLSAAELGFGVEIETNMPENGGFVVNRYHERVNVVYLDFLPANSAGKRWKAEKDGSLSFGPGRRGVEFISPVLRGSDGVENLVSALETLNSRGARVNGSCGVHFTVDFPGDAAALARLISLVARFERGLFASTGTTSRENGTYCRPVKKGRVYRTTKSLDKAKEFETRYKYTKFSMLNLKKLAAGRGVVEFRLFSGSTNSHKILGWLWLCLGLVESALNGKRAVGWDVSGNWSDRPGAGEGEKHLTYLFERLGWRRDNRHHVGHVAGPSAPSLKSVKRKLSEMAAKYDEMVDREERERLERLERERLERERWERERRELVERNRLELVERNRRVVERNRLDRERLDRERLERNRLERERALAESTENNAA